MLNQTQSKAYRWLTRIFNLTEDDIRYQDDIPSFKTKDGRLWAIKKLYGEKTVNMFPGEIAKLTQDADHTTLLLFTDDGVNPAKQIPARALLQDRETYDEYHFTYIEQKYDGEQEILLAFTRRTPTSKYWRCGHVNMGLLAMFAEGGYTGKASVNNNGKLTFFVKLRPAY